MRMVKEVRVALKVNDAWMVGKSQVRSPFHDIALVGPWPLDGGRSGVSNVLGNACSGINQVVKILALVHPGTLGVVATKNAVLVLLTTKSFHAQVGRIHNVPLTFNLIGKNRALVPPL